MATVTGALGNRAVSIPVAASLAGLTRSALATQGAMMATGPATANSSAPVLVADSALPLAITGTATSAPELILAGQNTSYATGTSAAALVIAADDTNSHIANTNPTGSLRALTGAGFSTLIGGGLNNAFQTGAGGQDSVQFSAGALTTQANLLLSAGQDTVSIAGPASGGTQANMISVLDGGRDAVTLGQGTTLTFIDASTLASTVTGAANSSVTMSGGGNAVLVAGAGPERFDASASTGNVTLVAGTGTDTLAGGSGADIFQFVRGAAGGTATILDFSGHDTLHLQGYGANPITAETAIPGGLQITLADNTTVLLQNVTALNPAQIRFT